MNKDIRLLQETYIKNILLEALSTGTMTPDQLVEYLKNIKGTKAVSVVVEAPVKMNKKNRNTGEPNPYLGTIKQSTISGIAGGDYELAVQNRELNAHSTDSDYMPSFKSEPIWKGKGQRVSPLLVQHVEKGDYYLVIGTPKSGTSTYTLNGDPIDKELLLPYVYTPVASVKQSAVGIQPEDQQKVRYPAIKNIKKINIDNTEITIV